MNLSILINSRKTRKINHKNIKTIKLIKKKNDNFICIFLIISFFLKVASSLIAFSLNSIILDSDKVKIELSQ